MPRAAARDAIYHRRRFDPEVIQLCVRWYLTYKLSYRDLAAMLAERDIHVTHTSIMRWVHRYVPEFEQRWNRHALRSGRSWRMDETSVSVGGRWRYLYRAVDRTGKTVHSELFSDRSIPTAQAFFCAAVKAPGAQWPEKINLDGSVSSRCALGLLGRKDPRWKAVEIRTRRYLNNVVEQDHRAIKQRCRPMLGMKTLRTAAVTLAGIELAHRIRKQQFALPRSHSPSHKALWDRVLLTQSGPGLGANANPALMHQNSLTGVSRRRRTRPMRQEVVRYARKTYFGQSLFQVVTPTGRRLWRYSYKFEGREKQISFGRFPEVSLEGARARHQAARRLLAEGIDPISRRLALRYLTL